MADPLVDLPPLPLSHAVGTSTRTRKVVAAVGHPVGDTGDATELYVFCDDGAVFVSRDGGGDTGWIEYDPIPGTPRDYQQKGEVADF